MGVGVPLGLVAGGVVSDRWGNAATFESALVGILVATLVAWRLVPDLRVAVPRRFGWSEIFKAMADRRLSAIGALTFAVAFSAQGMVLTTLSLLAHARGMSLLGFGDQGTSSVLMGLMVVVSAITMPVAGRWGDRHRAHAPIALAGLIVLVPSLVLIALSSTATGLVAGIALMGLGSGALSPSLLALVSELVPQDRRGVAIGVLGAFRGWSSCSLSRHGAPARMLHPTRGKAFALERGRVGGFAHGTRKSLNPNWSGRPP
jgi:predicted MFS family arabinose efflux permease